MNGRLTKTTQCRACGAEIAFIKTERGKTMPVNPEAISFTPAGGHDTFIMLDGRLMRGVMEKNGKLFGFVSHFATCPAANEMRKGRHKGKRTAEG